MTVRRIAICSLALTGSLVAAAGAFALQTPGRTQTRNAPITAIGLTHASVAFAVSRTKTDCDHVELWNTDTHGTWRFGRKQPCGDLPLLFGIGPIGVAANRVVWVSFAGGNLTDWQLWTATPTKKTPRRLAFVERDTMDAPAIVVGPGTERAVPYAVGTSVTWLGENGAAVFRWTAPSEVRTITSGAGPYGWSVAALLASGDVTVLNASGAVARTYTFAPGAARWIGLAPSGLVVQVAGARVEIHRGSVTRTVQLKPNAIVLDYAEGRILYRVGQTFWLRHVGSGTDMQLLQGLRRQPLAVELDTHGLAWARGRNGQLGLRRLHRRVVGRASPNVHRVVTLRLPNRPGRGSMVAAMETARIAAIPLFAGLPEVDLNRLAEAATELDLVQGATLTMEGEFGHTLFAIEEGTAGVLADGRIVRTVGPGDVVGEVAVVASGRRTATVVATSPMRLIALFKRDVWAVERRSPEVAKRLRELLALHRDNG